MSKTCRDHASSILLAATASPVFFSPYRIRLPRLIYAIATARSFCIPENSQPVKWLVQRLRLSEGLIEPPSFALRVYQYVKDNDPPETPLLNSFFLHDLATARHLVAGHKANHALRLYLGIERPSHTHDLLARLYPFLIFEKKTQDTSAPDDFRQEMSEEAEHALRVYRPDGSICAAVLQASVPTRARPAGWCHPRTWQTHRDSGFASHG
jgi:hypothetical protein